VSISHIEMRLKFQDLIQQYSTQERPGYQMLCRKVQSFQFDLLSVTVVYTILTTVCVGTENAAVSLVK
jgi:hypothetical protein